MKFSAFARFGHLRFSGKKPVGQSIYESMRAGLGGEENLGEDTFSGPMAGELFATAMALANVQRAVDRANLERVPHTADQLLEMHERDYRIVPAPGSSRDDRRAELQVAELLSRGCGGEAVATALGDLLGAELIAIRTPTAAEAKVSPATWETTPGTWKKPDVLTKWHRLTVAQGPGAVTLSTEPVIADSEPLTGGDRVVVDPGQTGIQEPVTLGASGLNVTATLVRRHEVGTIVTTEPWPTAQNSSRHMLIVVTATVARSSAWRKRIENVLGKMLRAVDRYSVVEEYSAGVLGPFYADEGIPGITIVGTIPTTPS